MNTMNTLKFQMIFALFATIEIATSLTVNNSKMTWADVFRDRTEEAESKRQQRSHLTTKKSFVLNHAGQPEADEEHYSLQYIDQTDGGQYQDQLKSSLLTAGKTYKYVTVKDDSAFIEESTKGSSLQAPLSYIYSEAEQSPHDGFTPSKELNLHQLSLNNHYYRKLKHYEPSDEDTYASNYKFGYRVSDPHTGAEFGHAEVSEGHMKKGHYHVLLPDGRLQNVKYWADPTGYHATVTYEGQSHYHPAYH